jgi:hypothetical protein
MAQARFISADSHLMEPADFWRERLDNRFKGQAPRVVKRPDDKGYLFVAPEINPFPVAGGFAAGRSGQELKDFMDKGYEAARPSVMGPCRADQRPESGRRGGGSALPDACDGVVPGPGA